MTQNKFHHLIIINESHLEISIWKSQCFGCSKIVFNGKSFHNYFSNQNFSKLWKAEFKLKSLRAFCKFLGVFFCVKRMCVVWNSTFIYQIKKLFTYNSKFFIGKSLYCHEKFLGHPLWSENWPQKAENRLILIHIPLSLTAQRSRSLYFSLAGRVYICNGRRRGVQQKA